MYITQPTLNHIKSIGFALKNKLHMQKSLFRRVDLSVELQQAKHDDHRYTFVFTFRIDGEAYALSPNAFLHGKAESDGYYSITNREQSHQSLESDLLFFLDAVAQVSSPQELLAWVEWLRGLRQKERLGVKLESWWGRVMGGSEPTIYEDELARLEKAIQEMS